MMMDGRNSSGRINPFTASQWQELGRQALIFNYMASGHPIPSDLLLPIRRSLSLDATTSPASLFPHQPNIGWGCLQMGFGRKAEDPEPGRCRRTDGKKWRCSKEAYLESKYCEKHMHRGKNRSRKPVEMSLNTANTATTTSQYPSSSLYHPLPMMTASDAHRPTSQYPSYSSYSRPPTGFSLDSGGGSTSADRDCNSKHFHGLMVGDSVDQYTSFSDSSGAERDGSWRFTPLGMNSCYSSHLDADLQKAREGERRQQQQQQQHCFVLGADIKLGRKVDGEEDGGESQRPLRHFIDDWSLKSKVDSWDGVGEKRSSWDSYSKTQLSISIRPVANHDYPISSSHSNHGD